MKPGQHARYRVQCLHDPSEGAPFRGNFFSWQEIKELLRFAYLPPGSVWSVKGRAYGVVGAVNLSDYPANVPQQLAPCQWPKAPALVTN